MKIRRNAWRGWARLGVKLVVVAGLAYLMFGCWYGVGRVSGGEILSDGDLVLFFRLTKDYQAGDVLMMADGSAARVGEAREGKVLGKIIARLSVRNFDNGAANH